MWRTVNFDDFTNYFAISKTPCKWNNSVLYSIFFSLEDFSHEIYSRLNHVFSDINSVFFLKHRNIYWMSISHCHPLINIWIIARFVFIMIKTATFCFMDIYTYIYIFISHRQILSYSTCWIICMFNFIRNRQIIFQIFWNVLHFN